MHFSFREARIREYLDCEILQLLELEILETSFAPSDLIVGGSIWFFFADLMFSFVTF